MCVCTHVCACTRTNHSRYQMLVISSEAVVGCGHSCPRADTLRPAALSCDTGALRRRQAGFSQKERRAALFIHLAHSIRSGPRPGSQCSHPPGSSGLTGKYTDNNRNKKGLGLRSQLCP